MTREEGFCVFGATGQGLAVANISHVRRNRDLFGPLIAFIDDVRGGQGLELGNVPILSFDEWRARYLRLPCLISLGLPAHRRTLADRLDQAGARLLRLHDDACAFPHATVGPGAIVADQTYVGPLTTIGRNALILTHVSIGHDVVVGDHSTICSLTAISGYVEIGEDVFIGAGSTVTPGRPGRWLRIGAGAEIAAGTVITRDVPPGARMIGNPATSMREAVAARRADSAARRPDAAE